MLAIAPREHLGSLAFVENSSELCLQAAHYLKSSLEPWATALCTALFSFGRKASVMTHAAAWSAFGSLPPNAVTDVLNTCCVPLAAMLHAAPHSWQATIVNARVSDGAALSVPSSALASCWSLLPPLEELTVTDTNNESGWLLRRALLTQPDLRALRLRPSTGHRSPPLLNCSNAGAAFGAVVATCTKLTRLSFAAVGSTAPGLDDDAAVELLQHLTALSNLRVLEAPHCNFATASGKRLATLLAHTPHLTALCLTRNTKLCPLAFKALSRNLPMLSRLQALTLDGCNHVASVSSNLISAICHLPALRQLSLQSTGLSSTADSTIPQRSLPSTLAVVCLADNPLQGACAGLLSGLADAAASLTCLDIGSTCASPAQVHLFSVPLHLRMCTLSPQGPCMCAFYSIASSAHDCVACWVTVTTSVLPCRRGR